MAEYLSAFFPTGTADLVIIQNALDHSAQPLKGIIEALDVLKPGGVLYLNHHPNEAVTEHYKGFHQFNINEEDGRLIIWSREQRICVDELLEQFADVSTCRHENGHVVSVITKRATVPPELLTDKADKQQLCTTLMEATQHRADILGAIRYKLSYWKYNTIQFVAQALPWELKMKVKKLIHQTPDAS
jgi:SAM-dependent methyltransferase